jgi:hypothetical protein
MMADYPNYLIPPDHQRPALAQVGGDFAIDHQVFYFNRVAFHA